MPPVEVEGRLAPATLLNDAFAGVSAGRRISVDEAAKRVLDVAVASLVLVLALPLLVTAGIALRIDSPGPIVIRQRRVGRRGRVFRMLKLRTMVDGSHPFSDKRREDERVTRVGHVLRTASIDELPQLWNVIRGEMSLVGPRPLPVDEHVARGSPGGARLTVRPGLSGLWQVRGRSTLSFEERLRLDDHYARNRTLAWDLLLLVQTLPAVLSRRGAY